MTMEENFREGRIFSGGVAEAEDKKCQEKKKKELHIFFLNSPETVIVGHSHPDQLCLAPQQIETSVVPLVIGKYNNQASSINTQ